MRRGARRVRPIPDHTAGLLDGLSTSVQTGRGANGPHPGRETALAVFGLVGPCDPGRMMMLQMRPGCECCDVDLPPESDEAMICSFECTYCRRCATDVLRGWCPNCGGEIVARPRRAARLLDKYPASTERIHRPGCAERAAAAGRGEAS